jgi:class 3 adenylate cyclase
MADLDLPTGTVAFLFTDLEGSTHLLQAHPATYRSAVRQHHDLLAEAVRVHRGAVFETVGDVAYAAFATATGAVAVSPAASATHPSATSLPRPTRIPRAPAPFARAGSVRLANAVLRRLLLGQPGSLHSAGEGVERAGVEVALGSRFGVGWRVAMP